MTRTYDDTPKVGSIYKDRVPEDDSGHEFLCVAINHKNYPPYFMMDLSLEDDYGDYYHGVDWEFLRVDKPKPID